MQKKKAKKKQLFIESKNPHCRMKENSVSYFVDLTTW